MDLPRTLALDFDGVLCNGLQEYFQTTWRAYRQLWPTSSATPSHEIVEIFYQLRPVVETGWEMPVLLRAIIQGFATSDILDQWFTIRDRVVAQEDLNPQDLGNRVDGVRDQWINQDLSSWLQLHCFYPGVVTQLQSWLQQPLSLFIITTKESRFVAALLQQEGLNIRRDRIFGKDCRRPKAETLRQLKQTTPAPIWFVEDRLATLQGIQQQPDLQDIGLFLGDWGYNTARDRQTASPATGIDLLTLDQFTQGFDRWL